MNFTRIAILGVAAAAAGGAALLVRGMVGGEPTPSASASVPPPAITVDVLVASTTVPPGRKLEVGVVRWDSWPKTSVPDDFVTKDKQPDLAKAVEGIIVRSPLVAGQPITNLNTVRSDARGFMSATLMPGMRAIATNVTAESSAGGFLLPNDRVDVILTHDVSGGSSTKIWRSDTILTDVRVLAVDQSAEPAFAGESAVAGTAADPAAVSDTESKVGKTVTLELFPRQAELLQRAVASGNLSLALRSLGDSDGRVGTAVPALGAASLSSSTVVRYGIVRDAKEIVGR